LELDPQPAANRAYTESDIQIRRLRRVRDQFQIGEEVIIKTQSRLGIINIKKQAKRVRRGLLADVIIKGFVSNFRASANGTSKPDMDGLFGPRRNIIYPKTLRSNKVKKATDTSNSKSEAMETMF